MSAPILLFTKSYARDVPWLDLSIKTVLHFARAPVEWHIVADSNALDGVKRSIDSRMKEAPRDDITFFTHSTRDLWPECLKMSSGYHAQQWVKMTAHRVIGKRISWNVDSDVCFRRPFALPDLHPNGKPLLWVSRYNDIWSDNHAAAFNARRLVQSVIFNLSPDIPLEFMRCMPIVIHGAMTEQAENTPEWKRSYDSIMSANPGFSEFNVLGQFALMHFPDWFDWRNAETDGPTFGSGLSPLISQKWSYGGITPEYRSEIERICTK